MKSENYLKTIFWRYVLLFLFACALTWLTTGSAHCQVSPFMGLGNAQFFDNNGKPLTAGVLYSYQAGTTMQQATFTDSTGIILNTNPIPFTTGARVAIWLTSGAFYKFVLCAQNDGPTCAPADVLFSVDQVPGSPAGSSGGGSSSPFISGSSNPATTGILRLASGDAICWRNAANNANLCITKDTSDVLAWAGGVMKFPETACSAAATGFDYLCADSTAHRWTFTGNGGSRTVFAAQGQDINSSDFVTQLHMGSTALPLGTTPVTTNQGLGWSGTAFVGYNFATFATVTSAALNFGSSLSSTTLIASVVTTGPIYVQMQAVVSTAGVGCSNVAGNTITPTVSFTAPGGTVENSTGAPFNYTGNPPLDAGSAQASSATTFPPITAIIAKAGTAVSISTTSVLTSTGCSTTPQYIIYAKAIY